MQVTDAIYKRRAIRSYQDRMVDEDTLRLILAAAVQAPSAINQQPWSFAIIQDKDLLRNYSDQAKQLVLNSMGADSPLSNFRETLSDPNFNIFYNAGTLLVIYGKDDSAGAAEDCCLAAENLMLSALDFGLATCPIGFARAWLNQPSVKRELNIPAEYTAVFPIIIGYPQSEVPPVPRRDPEVVAWRRTTSHRDTLSHV